MHRIELGRDVGNVRSRILVIDDEQGPRDSLRMILSAGHEVLCARDGAEALEVLQATPVDLVTLDLNMPGVKGAELMHTLRSEYPEIEIIIITGNGCLRSATEGLRAGIADYLEKPFDVVQVTAAVERALARSRGRRRLLVFLESIRSLLGLEDQAADVLHQIEDNAGLRQQVGELLAIAAAGSREEQNAPRTLCFLETLATTIEAQAPMMRGHGRRVAYSSSLLADRLLLSSEERERLRLAGFLHDLGKIGVPTDLLTRSAPLSPEEHAVVRQHPAIGARLVQPIGISAGIVATIRHHHERWDGAGYPDGLAGEEIPLSARIVAVADAYDAMTHDRPYRSALDPEVVRRELETCAGSQFDPVLAKEFLSLVEAGTFAGDVDDVADALAPTLTGILGGAGRCMDANRGGVAR